MCMSRSRGAGDGEQEKPPCPPVPCVLSPLERYRPERVAVVVDGDDRMRGAATRRRRRNGYEDVRPAVERRELTDAAGDRLRPRGELGLVRSSQKGRFGGAWSGPTRPVSTCAAK